MQDVKGLSLLLKPKDVLGSKKPMALDEGDQLSLSSFHAKDTGDREKAHPPFPRLRTAVICQVLCVHCHLTFKTPPCSYHHPLSINEDQGS